MMCERRGHQKRRQSGDPNNAKGKDFRKVQRHSIQIFCQYLSFRLDVVRITVIIVNLSLYLSKNTQRLKISLMT